MTTTALRIFVYGTLKRGCGNHDRFCRDAIDVQNAVIRGRLYEGPGFPFLEVLERDVIASGTSDVEADAAQCYRTTGIPYLGGWGMVLGERVTFASAHHLSELDRLEGFDPGHGPGSLYRRVLVNAIVDGIEERAWAYAIGPEGQRIKGDLIYSGQWHQDGIPAKNAQITRR